MMQLRRSLSFLARIIGVFLLSLLFIEGATAQAPIFRIGVLAAPDTPLARGAATQVDQINDEQGGVIGADGTRFQLALVYTPVDGGNTIEGAVAQLIDENVIAVIGPQTTPEVNAYLPTLTALNVPILTPATGDNLIIADESNLLFRVRAADVLLAQSLAEYLVQDKAVNRAALYQLDIDATALALGFQNAAQAQGADVNPAQIATNPAQITTEVETIIDTTPDAVVVYGPPTLASQFYRELRQGGYDGLFAYGRPQAQEFVSDFSVEDLSGIIGANTWSFAATDRLSTAFTLAYLRAYQGLPDALSAAGADAVALLAEAIGQPGDLQTNLQNLSGIIGIQGVLSPVSLNSGEMSDNVVVFEYNDNGEIDVMARFSGSQRLPESTPDTLLVTPTPTPTATPEGVVVTIISRVQNVCTGPSTVFDVIGQLERDEQVQLIGASADFSWLVIRFRGQQGWIANLENLNSVFGDLDSLPVVASPPTPTPAASPTPVATPVPQLADIVIESASVSPNPIRPNQNATVSVTVANRGGADAGQFAVATTLQPGNVYTATTIDSLGAGQTTTINLNGTLSNTGNYSVVIVADLNNQILEGSGEDNNNTFNFSYRVEQPIVGSGTQTVSSGGSFNFGNGVTINWNGTDFTTGSGPIGEIEGVSFENVHYDLINGGIADKSTIRPEIGDVIVVLNANGDRGALRVDNIDGSNITGTFKAYNNAS